MDDNLQHNLLARLNALLGFLHGKSAAAVAKFGNGVAYLNDYQRFRYEFALREDDIFIVTYPRSGTTWLQMILYQLTSDGEMDFFHINEKAPFLERAVQRGIDLSDRSDPRIFKSHLRYELIPHGSCRYIYAVRDGRDVAVSYYRLCQDYNAFAGSFDEFLQRFFRGRLHYGSWFKHVQGWRENRDNLNVLYVSYEDLQADLVREIQRIARFCAIPLTEAKLARMVQRSQLAFMKQHKEKFDHSNQDLAERGVKERQFLGEGKTGTWTDHFSEAQQKMFEQHYRRVLGNTQFRESRQQFPADCSQR